MSSRFLSAGTTSIALLLCASLHAQVAQRLGFTATFGTSFTDRIGGNAIVGDALQHFDSRNYQEFLLDPANPLNYLFTGVRFVMQDQQAPTAETYTVCGYNEDPLTPNFPDPVGTALWFRTGVISYPPMPAGWTNPAIAWVITVTFTTPSVPKGEKWIGLGLPQPLVGTWPADGLSMHCAFDFPPGNTGTNQLDRPGRGIIGATMPPIAPNLSCFIPTAAGLPTGPAVYPSGAVGSRRQINLDLFANVTGGVVVSQTNQTRYVSSNPGGAVPEMPLGGTPNMLSGSNPDTFDFNVSTPARADDVGFLVTNTNFPGAPLFLLQGFGPSPIPGLTVASVSSLAQPTSKGVICIDFTSADTSLTIAFMNAAGRYQHLIAIPPAVRTTVSLISPGIDVWYQAFVLNVASCSDPTCPAPWELHATGCGIQHL